MLTKKEKKFFADTAWGASKLSICPSQKGAILINGRQIQSYGFNRKIVKDKDWEISAIYDVFFSALDVDMSDFTLFSTYFPTFDDMRLIVATGVSAIYYFGEVNDVKTVELLNNLAKNSIPLEIIHLE